MMQLFCSNTRLDLYEDTSLQFTHENPLFAFDKMSCERTTEFKLPTTPTNDRVFSLARIPAYRGEGMRRRFDAQLYAGTVVKDGYLYVSAFDGKDYSAIFITGELLGLKQIREAGTAKEVLSYDSTVVWNDENVRNANLSSIDFAALVRYAKDTAHWCPSLNLKKIIQDMATKLGVSVSFANTAAADRVRLVANSEDYELDTYLATLHFISAQPMATTIAPTLGIAAYETLESHVWLATTMQSAGGFSWDDQNAQLVERRQFRQIRFPFPVVLKFAEDTPENMCVVVSDIMQQNELNETGTAGVDFIDEREFYPIADNQIAYRGEPLAGRKVSIPAGRSFTLISGDGYRYQFADRAEKEAELGYYITQSQGPTPSFDVKVEVSIDHKWIYGENIPLNALLPDLSFVELCRIFAAITGTILTYNGSGLEFSRLDLAQFDGAAAEKVVSVGNVSRTFSDYAQRNTMQFESDEDVLNNERIIEAYTIDNDNLAAMKELQVLKVSEGRRQIEMVNGAAIERLRIQTYNDANIIGNAKTNDTYMQRVELPKNTGIQALCDASTQVEVQVRMSLMEYEAIKPNTKIWLRGTEYVWTSRSWQKEVAKFVLAKI